MNTETFFQLIQQGFHIGVGATTSFLETLQDPQKRADTLSTLQTQLFHQAQEWAEKGEMTEQEARRLIDQWLSQQNKTSTTHDSSTSSTSPGNDNVEAEIQQLTEQVIALRRELEQKRQQN